MFVWVGGVTPEPDVPAWVSTVVLLEKLIWMNAEGVVMVVWVL